MFTCHAGGCIPYERICDNVTHCPDGSDEKPSFCSMYSELKMILYNTLDLVHTLYCLVYFWFGCQFSVTRICPSGFFPCYNNRCVAMSLQCDGVNDCGDSSDELNCRCGVEEFRCATSGNCIKAKHR